MSSPLKKLVLPATVLAGTVFSSLTVPLAVFGSEPIDIQLNQEPIFSGKVKDFAAPYVGVVGILSIGTGVAGVAIAGWQQSSRKSGQVETKLSNLQQTLAAKELQLETVMLSEKRLEASGLDFFLQDDQAIAPLVAEAEFKSVVCKAQAPVVDARVASTQSAKPVEAEPTQAAVQSVVSTLAAAQAFLSFTRSNGLSQAGYESPAIEPTVANVSLQELQDQLKQIMSQVEALRSSIEPAPQPTPRQAQQRAYTVNTPEPHHHRPVAQPQWVMQPLAS